MERNDILLDLLTYECPSGEKRTAGLYGESEIETVPAPKFHGSIKLQVEATQLDSLCKSLLMVLDTLGKRNLHHCQLRMKLTLWRSMVTILPQKMFQPRTPKHSPPVLQVSLS